MTRCRLVVVGVALWLLLAAPATAQTFAGTGTVADPWHAMSCDPVQAAKDVRGSLAFWGKTDDAYWVKFTATLNPWGDGWWCGWNKYWEDRTDPANPGSDARENRQLPSLHRVPDGTPDVVVVPVSQPPSTPAVVRDQSAMLDAIANLQAALYAVGQEVHVINQEQEAIAAEHRTMHQQVVGLIQALPQTLQAPSSGPSMFGKIGGALGSFFSNPAVLTGVATLATCVISKKCG